MNVFGRVTVVIVFAERVLLVVCILDFSRSHYFVVTHFFNCFGTRGAHGAGLVLSFVWVARLRGSFVPTLSFSWASCELPQGCLVFVSVLNDYSADTHNCIFQVFVAYGGFGVSFFALSLVPIVVCHMWDALRLFAWWSRKHDVVDHACSDTHGFNEKPLVSMGVGMECIH